MAQDNREKYAYLDQLSTRRLEELLLADAEDDSGRDTSEVIFHILEVLQKREDGLTVEPVDVDRAWEDFQRYYHTPEGEGQALFPCEEDKHDQPERIAPIPKLRSPTLWKTLRIAAATVAILFALMVGAQASGLDVFGALAQWTSETFHFGAKRTRIQSEYYDEFLELLTENDIQKDIAPTWIPDGFEALEPEVWGDDTGVFIQFLFSDKAGKSFAISIGRYYSLDDVEQVVFERDGIPVESYTSNSYTFYIFSNLTAVTATRTEGTLIETIWGDLSIEEVKSIIDSIGKL